MSKRPIALIAGAGPRLKQHLVNLFEHNADQALSLKRHPQTRFKTDLRPMRETF